MNRPGLEIRPLTPDLWPALEDLFGTRGACNGCWCMYWRIGSAYFFKRTREQNRAALRALVRRGPPPGLLAFDGERAVGWCQLTPRAALPYLDQSPRFPRVDDRPVWSVSCFYVRRGYRKQGVMPQLLAAAISAARRARAPALEAYPVDTDKPGSTANTFTGTASTFARAGFTTVGGRSPSRPVMRYELGRRRRAARPRLVRPDA
jgi:GNAT superfamily N-acetyltransferase